MVDLCPVVERSSIWIVGWKPDWKKPVYGLKRLVLERSAKSPDNHINTGHQNCLVFKCLVFRWSLYSGNLNKEYLNNELLLERKIKFLHIVKNLVRYWNGNPVFRPPFGYWSNIQMVVWIWHLNTRPLAVVQLWNISGSLVFRSPLYWTIIILWPSRMKRELRLNKNNLNWMLHSQPTFSLCCIW